MTENNSYNLVVPTVVMPLKSIDPPPGQTIDGQMDMCTTSSVNFYMQNRTSHMLILKVYALYLTIMRSHKLAFKITMFAGRETVINIFWGKSSWHLMRVSSDQSQ